MEYDDFVLQFTPAPGGGYAARVTGSPAGEAEGVFRIPIGKEELASFTAEVLRGLGGANRNLRPALTAGLAEPPLRAFGDRLFASLFSLPLRSRLDESLGLLGSAPERGLRLRLQMSLDDPALARLQALPWEFLFRAEQGAFLGLSSRIALVRSPSLPLAGQRTPASRPLRLLAVICEPPGLPPLDLERERAALERICSAGLATVRTLRRPTLDELRRALRDEKPHILHVMGHGDFTAATGEGNLFFAGEEGATSVDGLLLADHLRDCPSLLLVFLNACQTARLAAPNPFAGLATALLQAGVPAVIAMQFPIRDDAAVTFSAEVYRQLAQGEPIESAVAEGRLAIRRLLPAALEWGTPVLFLRASDGHLFREPHPVLQPLPPAPAMAPRRRWPALAGLSAAGMSVLALGLGLGRGSLGPDHATSQPPIQTEPAIHRDPPPPAVQGSEPRLDVDGARTAQPPAPHRWGKSPGHKDLPAPEPRPSPARIGPYKVASDTPVYLPEIQANVSVQFFDVAGARVFRLALSPEHGSFAQSQAQLGGGSVDFDTGAGKVAIDVLSVDWESQTVTVQPRKG
jgi:CHAT domain-containing protein